MANRCWVLAGVLAVVCVVACNSDKPSPWATKSSAPARSAAAGSAASGSAASGSAAAGSAAVDVGSGAAFKVGDVAWSLWDNGFAYRGKIVGINDDGTYAIEWDDKLGRNDRWPAKALGAEKPAENPLKVGERVWSRPEMWDNNRASQGKILRINKDGTYRISWDDTDDTDTEKYWLQRTKPAPLPKKPAASSTAASSKSSGDKPCPEGPDWTRCKDWGCQKLSTSNQHCGACGHGCRGDQTCNNGVCGCHSYEHLDENGRCSS